jgi:hypothetical protein
MRELQAVRRFIYDTLKENSQIAAILGTRIYPYTAPSGVGYPFITVTFSGGSPTYSAGPNKIYVRPTYQIKAVTKTSLKDATDLATLMEEALSQSEGTSVSDIGHTFFVNTPTIDQPIELITIENEIRYYHAGGVYRFFIQQTS